MVQKNEVSERNTVTARTLVEQFLKGDDEAAMMAAWHLCIMPQAEDDEAVMLTPLAMVLQSDKKVKKRLLAAKILGRHSVGCDTGFAALCEGLNMDVSEKVRVQCALSLGQLAHHETLAVFRQALEWAESEYLRLGILAGLRELYSRESLGLLRAIARNAVESENVRLMAQSVAESVESSHPSDYCCSN